MKLRIISPLETEIVLENSARVFYSYGTPVVAYKPGLGWVKTSKYHSATTNKHINNYLVAHAGKERAEEVPQDVLDNIESQMDKEPE